MAEDETGETEGGVGLGTLGTLYMCACHVSRLTV